MSSAHRRDPTPDSSILARRGLRDRPRPGHRQAVRDHLLTLVEADLDGPPGSAVQILSTTLSDTRGAGSPTSFAFPPNAPPDRVSKQMATVTTSGHRRPW